MSTEKIGFGYIDDTSEDLKSKSGGKFGLNQGAYLVKFELNENAGAQGAPGIALDYTVQVGDKQFMNRIYPTDKVYDRNGNEITDTNSEEYIKGYNADWKQKNAVVVHILKNFKSDEQVRQAFNTNIPDFKSFVNVAVGVLPANFNSIPLDAFLEYQWSISEGQDRTFLQLPKNMKGGYFLVPMQQPAGGEWKEVRNDKGLHYVDAQGNKHPFERDANFMNSNKAHQQVEGEEGAADALNNAAGATAGTGGAARSSSW